MADVPLSKEGVIAVRAKGHAGQRLSVAPGNAYRVTLDPAYILTIKCLDATGLPLPGISFAITRAGMLTTRTYQYPGLDPQTAVYSGVTDSEGIAVVSGLPKSDYAVIPLIDCSYTLLESNVLPTLRADVPGADVEFRLSELYAAVIGIDGDNLGCWSLVSTSGFGRGGGYRSVNWGPAIRQLEERYPHHAVVVTSPDLRAEAPRARFKFFLQERGWQPPVEIELAPWSQITPKRLDYSGSPIPSICPSGTVTIQVEGADGQDIKWAIKDLSFDIHEDNHLRSEILSTARPGEPVIVPVGHRAVYPVTAEYGNYLKPAVFDVAPGQQLTIPVTFSDKIYPVMFSTAVAGQLVNGGVVISKATHLRHQFVNVVLGDKGQLGMAQGEWRIRLLKDGCEPAEVSVIVEPTDLKQIFTIDMIPTVK